jgi:phage repressor protein C with HTH and peptisase S24 domain
MNWEQHKNTLAEGQSVKFRPKGNSMSPKIDSGDLVTVAPIGNSLEEQKKINKGDIVFCKVGRNFYVHLVQSIDQKMGGFRYQIGNNKKHTNGTIGIEQIFGKVVNVEK